MESRATGDFLDLDNCLESVIHPEQCHAQIEEQKQHQSSAGCHNPHVLTNDYLQFNSHSNEAQHQLIASWAIKMIALEKERNSQGKAD